jgi:hypothetical protein
VSSVQPASYFGGNSDGAVRMERWLDLTCPGCKHGESVDGQSGVGCPLTAAAYAAPYAVVAAWQEDHLAPMGLRCHAREDRPTRRQRDPKSEVDGQMSIEDALAE